MTNRSMTLLSIEGKERIVYECRRSRRTNSLSDSSRSQRVCRSSGPVCMPFKCISRIFVHQPAAGDPVHVEWIRTHSFHDPSQKDEFRFRTVPKWVMRDIFSQFQMGIEPERILSNIRGDDTGTLRRSGEHVRHPT